LHYTAQALRGSAAVGRWICDQDPAEAVVMMNTQTLFNGLTATMDASVA
jgi:hypothetical protein